LLQSLLPFNHALRENGFCLFRPRHKYLFRTIVFVLLLLGPLSRPALAQSQLVTHDDGNQVPQNTPKSGNVLVNDDNPANLPTSVFGVTLVTPPTHGSLTTFSPDGSYTYVPAAGYLGADSFTYRICQPRNSGTCSNTSTVALNVYDPTEACTQGTGLNLLQNPSFTLGNVGFTSGYTFVADPSPAAVYASGTYAVGSEAHAYHSDFTGTGRTGVGDNFLIVNGDAALRSVYAQTVTVLPNRFYTISAYAVSVHASSPAQLGLIVDGKSTSVITTLPAVVGQYVKLADLYFSGPGPATGWQVTFEVRDLNKTLTGNDFGLDEVYFGSCSTYLLADTKTASPVSGAGAPPPLPPLSATLKAGANVGVQVAFFTITSLPATGRLSYNGAPVTLGQVIPVGSPGSLSSGGLLAYDPLGSCVSATFTYTATDNAGNGSSNTATYTLPLPQAVSAVIRAPAGPFCAGARVRLSAGAQPAGYVYTWYCGSTVANGVGNALNDSTFLATTSGTYTVKVASATCADTSPAVALTLLPAVTAGTIGTAQTVCVGAVPAALTSLAEASGGTGTYSYQWESSPDNVTWTAIGAATAATYVPGPLATTTYFRRQVRSGPCASAYSVAVQLLVLPPLAARVALPSPPAQCPGTALTFVPVVANAGSSPTYRWLVNGGLVATSSTFTSTTLANGDQVQVEVTPTAGGCSTGPVTATVTATVTAPPASTLRIAAQPAEPVCPGEAITFNLTQLTNGGSAPHFQWQVDGAAVAGATSPTFASTTLREGQVVSLLVQTTGACSQVVSSNPLRVAIRPVASVSAGPNKTIVAGTHVVLEGTASGNHPVVWSPSQGLIMGSDPLRPAAAPATTTTYTLTAGTGGCTSSSQVTVLVLPPLRIPNAFTPNGDGRDDTWQIDQLDSFSDNRVLVFNRWGTKVFETQHYRRGSEWDGTISGAAAPVGTYYYLITLGTGSSYTGSITVLR
jgi:gliding motility-associated-like protein